MEILQLFGIELKFFLTISIGFLVLFFVLKTYAFGPIFGMLQARQDKIRGDLDDAEARRNEMVALQKQYEERLAQIEDEARDKIQEATRQAQVAREELLEKARAEAQAIVERARGEIVREQEIANAEMRNQIAQLSTQVAGRLIKQTLDPSAHARLIDDIIAGIGTTANGVSNGGTR
jgi:F-type H+-transporting ATPase subunit b